MTYGVFPSSAGGGGGWNGPGFPSLAITQANVPLTVGQAVYFDALQGWIPATANAPGTLGIAIVVAQSGPTQYTIVFSGDVTGLPNQMPIEQGGILAPAPLTPGQYYFVSAVIAGALTLAEPGTYSNPILFALSATEAIVLPYRPSLTRAGGGPAPAIDANDRYVYACDELAGPLLNTGTGPLGALTVSGSPRYESGRLTRSAPSILFPADAATDGADSGMGLDASGAGLTLEAFVQPEGIPFPFGWPISVSAGNAGLNWAGIGAIPGSNTWYATIQVNGTQRNTAGQTGTKVAIRYGVPTYLALTYDGNQLCLYIDGILRAIEYATLANQAWDRVLLGNAAVAPQPEVYAFQGAIMQARVGNVARSAAYILNHAETLFRM